MAKYSVTQIQTPAPYTYQSISSLGCCAKFRNLCQKYMGADMMAAISCSTREMHHYPVSNQGLNQLGYALIATSGAAEMELSRDRPVAADWNHHSCSQMFALRISNSAITRK